MDSQRLHCYWSSWYHRMWCITVCRGPMRNSIKSQWNVTCKFDEHSATRRFSGRFWPSCPRAVPHCATHRCCYEQYARRCCINGVPSLCCTIKPSPTTLNCSMWRKNCSSSWRWASCFRCHSIYCTLSSNISSHSRLRSCSRNACGITWKRIYRRRCNTVSQQMVSGVDSMSMRTMRTKFPIFSHFKVCTGDIQTI